MFDSGLDTERTFGHSREVSRTHVRRRRLAAGALLVLAVSVSAPAVSAAVTGSSRRPDVGGRYVVQAGDTLWSVAVSRAPGTDPRRVVQAIVDENQVDAGTLVPGQVLVIPA
jgi:nucleoid-associated protein YgaU